MPYPFDPTGLLPSNIINNEPHNVSVTNGVDNYLIVPLATPFHGSTFRLISPTGDMLTLGVDYEYTHHWAQATDVIGTPVYSGVVLLDVNADPGEYKLGYSTIGGNYVDNRPNAIQSGLHALGGISNIDWSTAPAAFPATPHSHPVSELDGMTQVYARLAAIESAITNQTNDITMADITDFGSATGPILQQLSDVEQAIIDRPDYGLVDAMAAMQAQLAILEMGAGGNGADLTALTNRVTGTESSITALNGGAILDYKVEFYGEVAAQLLLMNPLESVHVDHAADDAVIGDGGGDATVLVGWAVYCLLIHVRIYVCVTLLF